MANAEKVAAVAELTERFRGSSGAVLTEYRGLTVAQLAELRRSLGGHATFAVVKNTLTKIAVNEAGLDEQLSSLLAGPSAIAFVDGDVVEAAKGLRDFAKANPLLVIKGGVLDGKAMSPSEITKLADLEPREVLLAKLAGAMKASLAGAAATFNALPVQILQAMIALRGVYERHQVVSLNHGVGFSTVTAECGAPVLAGGVEPTNRFFDRFRRHGRASRGALLRASPDVQKDARPRSRHRVVRVLIDDDSPPEEAIGAQHVVGPRPVGLRDRAEVDHVVVVFRLLVLDARDAALDVHVRIPLRTGGQRLVVAERRS